MHESFESLNEDRRHPFCIRLLCEMTAVGRMIRSDDSLSDADKSEALKWVDEINHHVMGAFNNPKCSLMQLHGTIMLDSEHVKILPIVVASAWQSAEKWAARLPA